MKRKNQLAAYLDKLQTQGRYAFTQAEASAEMNVSQEALWLALSRLRKKKRLMRPVTGFYVIVPTEYQKAGVLPTTWFIDALMKYHQQDYYVGLLSAAAIYGAAHQQPQVFQVITTKPLRNIHVGRIQIQFLTKKQITPSSHQAIKTPTGYMQISLPEITAIDLVQYAKSAGHLSHVATVLTELHEEFNQERFREVFKTEHLEAPNIQRLGYLLSLVETKQEIIELLKEWIQKQKARIVRLRPDKHYNKQQKNLDWRLFVNENIEADI